LYETLTALDMERHLQRNREIYRAKRDRFERLLHRYLDGVLRWDKPSGGMFFWASLTGTIPASTFLHACLRAGVAFADGACFHAGAGGTEYLRLNFTQASDEEMERGLKILSEVIGEVGSPGDGNG
jgi:2-aminoadipate transaminase